MTKAKPTSRRLITFPELRLLKRISLGRIQIGQLMDQGKFPRSVRISSQRIGWHEDELDSWIEKLPKGGAI